jgi:protein-tyrosine-phosphatase
MAEALLRHEVARRGEAQTWKISSAGTWAEADLPATQFAHAVMARRGIQLVGHRSQPLIVEALREADIVLAMTRNHKEAIQAEFPRMADKVFLLSQLVDQVFDIEDPYGGSLEDYELCASDIESLLERGLDRLVELADRNVLPQV